MQEAGASIPHSGHACYALHVKSGSEESLPTVALCTHDQRPVVPAAQKLGHADDVD